MNAGTGALRWTAEVIGGSRNPPVVADGLYVAYACDLSYRFDAVTGDLVWSTFFGYRSRDPEG